MGSGVQTTCDGRSLIFLNGNPGLRVFRDGLALRVRSPGCADRLYPLSRIDTIWVTGLVEWQAAAWQACIRNGIWVYFYDGRGRFIGELQPALGKDDGLTQLLERWLMTVEGRQQWRDWYNAALANCLRRSAERCGVSCPEWKWSRWIDARLSELVRSSDLKSYRIWLRSAVEALVDERVRAGGLKLDRTFWGMIGIDPVTDIAALLYWQVIPDCLEEVRRLRKQQRLMPKEKLGIDGKTALDIVGGHRHKLLAGLVGHLQTLTEIATENVLSGDPGMHWSEVSTPDRCDTV